jgi:hypothetical protein
MRIIHLTAESGNKKGGKLEKILDSEGDPFCRIDILPTASPRAPHAGNWVRWIGVGNHPLSLVPAWFSGSR